MGRHTGGWVKLWRKIDESWVGQDVCAYCVFTWLMKKANHSPSKAWFDGSLIELTRGQVLTSISEIREQFRPRFGRKAIELRLARFEQDQMIVHKTSNRGTLITILNYEKYQGQEFDDEQQKSNQGATKEKQKSNQGETKEQPRRNKRALNEECKKVKNEKKERMEEVPLPEPVALARVDGEKPPGSRVWDAYSEAYRRRHKINPTRNAKANSLCKQLVERLGFPDAAQVAIFYVGHNDSFYVRNMHALQYCIRDAEKLAAEWQKGSQMTGTKARQVEKTANAFDVIADMYRGGDYDPESYV